MQHAMKMELEVKKNVADGAAAAPGKAHETPNY